MLTQEQAVEVRVLKRQGRSIRQIAKQMELSRNTVRRYLREQPAVKYRPREARPCKLDPHKAHLKLRIEQARPDWIPATVLLREIQAAGYVGGISQLKSYLAQFKAHRVDPVVRFETSPGQQMQADFTIIRRGSDRLLAFVATLGFSRATFVRFTDTESFLAWRDGVVGALEYFGGVPREVLFDNAKSSSSNAIATDPASIAGMQGCSSAHATMDSRCECVARIALAPRARSSDSTDT